MRYFVTGLIFASFTTLCSASTTHPRAAHFSHHARHTRHLVPTKTKKHRPRWINMAMLSPIHGSHESLVRQNQMVTQDELERIQDDNQLLELTQNESLLALPMTRQITVDPTLPENRRFCRPWTKSFLTAFAEAHWLKFHRPMQVNSAVRTVQFQARLRHSNGNAAGLEGDTASPHLTGAAVDIAKHGMNKAELQWARQYLFDLQKQGKLDAEEEFRQPVFHVTVYKAFEGGEVARAH
jgi:hypothetical protein